MTKPRKRHRSGSKAEEVFAHQIRAAGLVAPVREYEFALALGRKFRADFAWPEHRLLWEISGGVFRKGAHSTGEGITRDHEKAAVAAALNWRVGMSTTGQVFEGTALHWLELALGHRRRQRTESYEAIPGSMLPISLQSLRKVYG